MRPVLRLLGTRYGMAVVLAVLVLAVVGVMRGGRRLQPADVGGRGRAAQQQHRPDRGK